eukprot:scaffold25790_cov59-Phaeocystis_antarctica.AAC.7
MPRTRPDIPRRPADTRRPLWSAGRQQSPRLQPPSRSVPVQEVTPHFCGEGGEGGGEARGGGGGEGEGAGGEGGEGGGRGGAGGAARPLHCPPKHRPSFSSMHQVPSATGDHVPGHAPSWHGSASWQLFAPKHGTSRQEAAFIVEDVPVVKDLAAVEPGAEAFGRRSHVRDDLARARARARVRVGVGVRFKVGVRVGAGARVGHTAPARFTVTLHPPVAHRGARPVRAAGYGVGAIARVEVAARSAPRRLAHARMPVCGRGHS